MLCDTANRFVPLAVLCASLCACASQPAAVKPLQIIAIDVEGGAATLYVTPEGKSLLIDTGWPAGMGGPRRSAPNTTAPATDPPTTVPPSSADRIIAEARKAGVNKLDFVLITHYHVDHVGGFSELLSKFPIGTLLDHGPNREEVPANADPASIARRPPSLYTNYEGMVAGHARRSLQSGDRVEIGSVVLTAVTSDSTVLSNPLPGAGQSNPHCAAMTEKSANGGEENPRSLGVLLNYGSARVISLGDVTWNLEKNLVCPVNKVGPVDLFMVSHHGSNFSNSPALLHALSPRVAVMNNGATKGGDLETYDTVAAAPGLQRLWQLHYATKGGAARNPAETYIANLTDDPDQYAALYISVFADGRMTLVNGRTGYSESHPTNVKTVSK